jgi:hypothetical protein
MKIRHLKGDSKTEEIIEYLRKRHPLYFIANKVSPEQITDLVNRLKYKVKQLESAKQSIDTGIVGKGGPKEDTSKKENSIPMRTTSLEPVSRP